MRPTPVATTERIGSLDALRGFALLGILLMNIPFFGLPHQTVEDLTIRDEFSGPDHWTWWIVNLFFEGSMRGLFSLLFGASMVLLISRLVPKSDSISAADIYYRRIIWLLLFGLFDAYILMWPGDILFRYAIAGLFLFPLRVLKPAHLFGIAGTLLVLMSAKYSYDRAEPLRLRAKAEAVGAIDTTATPLTEDQQGALQSWQAFQDKHSVEAKRADAAATASLTKGPLPVVFAHHAGITSWLQSTEYYRHGFLDAFVFMVIGIGLYHMGILQGHRRKRFYLLLALAGYALSLPIAYWMMRIQVDSRFDPVVFAERFPIHLYDFRRLALTFGHLGLFILVFKLGWFGWIQSLFAKVGRMAFSNYLLQNLLGSVLFFGYGFNLFDELPRHQLYYVLAGIWLVNIVFSVLWLRWYNMGPLEWAWRSLTYWNRLPLR